MLSEKITAYISDKPLGPNTTHVSFPVLITVNDTSYSAALLKAKEIFDKLTVVAERFQSESIQTSMNPVEDNPTTDTAADFMHSRKESTIELYVAINAKFVNDIEFWGKLESITQILDAIKEFSGNYDSNKHIRVEAGVHHVRARK